MTGAPPARALWYLNLDAEDELRHGAGYTPSRATLAAVATAREAARALLGPEDRLLGDAPVTPSEGDELRWGVAWCPTPSALARLAAAGAQVPVAPGLDTLREVNASRFTYDVLGARLSDAQVVSSLDAAETWLAARPPSEPVWLKRAFGAAGRGKLRAHGGALAPHTRAFLSPAELSLGVVLEPHVDITLEVAGLETHPHERDERGGRGGARHPLPEPVPHGELAHAGAQRLDVPGVELHVAHLVEADPQQAPAKLYGRVGKPQDGPAHQLGGLQLVVQERVQQLGACARVGQPLPPGCVLRDTQLGRASWPFGDHGRPTREVRRWHGRVELVYQALARDVAQRPRLDVLLARGCVGDCVGHARACHAVALQSRRWPRGRYQSSVLPRARHSGERARSP